MSDVVGLYVSPPAHAMVLSIDEKSQIQALDRTQPGLPLKRGRSATMTHDYKRRHDHAVCSSRCPDRRGVRAQHAAPPASGVHPLPQCSRSRYSGRQARPRDPRQLRHPQARESARLARSPFALNVPLHADFQFMVERPSRASSPSSRVAGLQNGVLRSVVDLQAAINRFIGEHNQSPKPFVGWANPEAIIAARNRGFQALESIHQHRQAIGSWDGVSRPLGSIASARVRSERTMIAHSHR